MIATPVLHLQGIGKLYAIPSDELRVSDDLVWNYDRGDGDIIQSIEHVSPKFYEVTTHSHQQEWKRRIKTGRLVSVRELVRVYNHEYRDTRNDLKNHIEPQLARALENVNHLIEHGTLDRLSRAMMFGTRDAIRDLLHERTA